MTGSWKSGIVGALALSVGLYGCMAMPTAQQGGVDRMDTLVKAADAASRSSFSITIKDNSPEAKAAAAQAAKGGYHVNYLLVNDWDTMKVTLDKLKLDTDGVTYVADSGFTPVIRSSTAGFNTADAARSATVSLTNLTAGPGYRIKVELLKTFTGVTNPVVIANGSYTGTGSGGFSLATGTNNLTVPLSYVVDPAGNNGGKIQISPTDAGSLTSAVTSVSTQSSFNIARVAGTNTATTPVAPQNTALGTYFTMTGGVVSDSNGKIFVADAGRNAIIQLDPAATTSGGSVIVAGSATGATGNAGDGGAAASATLNTPYGLAYIPSSTTLYVADYGNNRVRKIVPDGSGVNTIYNFAGGGSTTPGAVGTSVTTAGSASLSSPMGVAVDAAGNVYVTEYGTGRVDRINTDNSLTVVATGLGNVGPIAIDRTNNLLWVGNATGSLYKITNLSGTPAVATLPIGYGTDTEVRGLAYDQNGLLYLTASEKGAYYPGRDNNRILRLAVQTSGTNAGSIEANRGLEQIAGKNLNSDNTDSWVTATTTPVSNALNQGLNSVSWCGLFIDLYQANNGSTLSGALYESLYRRANTGYGHVVKLAPNTL